MSQLLLLHQNLGNYALNLLQEAQSHQVLQRLITTQLGARMVTPTYLVIGIHLTPTQPQGQLGQLLAQTH